MADDESLDLLIAALDEEVFETANDATVEEREEEEEEEEDDDGQCNVHIFAPFFSPFSFSLVLSLSHTHTHTLRFSYIWVSLYTIGLYEQQFEERVVCDRNEPLVTVTTFVSPLSPIISALPFPSRGRSPTSGGDEGDRRAPGATQARYCRAWEKEKGHHHQHWLTAADGSNARRDLLGRRSAGKTTDASCAS